MAEHRVFEHGFQDGKHEPSITFLAIATAARINAMPAYREMLIATTLALQLVACDPQEASSVQEVDPRAIVIPPPDVPDDNDAELYLIKGMSGLIDHGDELLVMVFGAGSREARIRAENVEAGQSSLNRWLASGGGHETVLRERFLRVPDLDDESGSRFYYFERSSSGEDWDFRAICTGAWDDDPAWPPTCNLTYVFGSKICLFVSRSLSYCADMKRS